MLVLGAVAVACFVGALVGCEVMRSLAIRQSLLDHANERSLHTAPTPRLGGVAIVVVALAASVLLARDSLRLVAASAVIALVGLRDDIKPMRAAVRLVVHAASAVAFLWLTGVPAFLVSETYALPLPDLVVALLLVVWVVGVLNIYNFMDGMDGLAGSQAVFAAGTYAILLLPTGGPAKIALVVAAAAAGFLAHNAPPARLFMGDAGATYLGFVFACLAVVGLHHAIPITQLTLPLAPFLLDGTFTILRRLKNREKIWVAHRTHLYQRAVQTGLTHRDVLLVYLVWMGACAAAALAGSSAVAVAAGWAVALLGLGLVWRWVGGRERRAVSS